MNHCVDNSLCLSLTDTDTPFSSLLSESHGFLCIFSASGDKSIETAFVVFACDMQSVSEGKYKVKEEQVLLTGFVCTIVYVHIIHIKMLTLMLGFD